MSIKIIRNPRRGSIAAVINEEFLNAPTAQQRQALEAATGDPRFRTMPVAELHRIIEQGIEEVMRGGRAQGGAMPAPRTGFNASTPDADLVEAMHNAPDMTAANEILRIAAERNAAQQGRPVVRFRPQKPGGEGADFPFPDLVRAMWNAPDMATANEILKVAAQRFAALKNGTSRAYNPAGKAVKRMTVQTVDRQGRLHQVPSDEVPEALQAGHTLVLPMTRKDGTHGYVPLLEVDSAKRKGYTLGHKSAGDDDSAPDTDATDDQDGTNPQDGMEANSGAPDFTDSQDDDMADALSGWASPAIDLSSQDAEHDDNAQPAFYPDSATAGMSSGSSFMGDLSASSDDSSQEDESSQGSDGMSYQNPTLMMNDAGDTFYRTDDDNSSEDMSSDDDGGSQDGAGAQLLPTAYGFAPQNGNGRHLPQAGPGANNLSAQQGNITKTPTQSEIKAYIIQQADAYGIPHSIALATAAQESNFDINELGGKGELGLFQIMPDTKTTTDAAGKGSALDKNKLKDDWQYNVRAGMSMLRESYKFAQKNRPNDVARATYAHYNAPKHWSQYTYHRGHIADHVRKWYSHYQEYGGH